MRRRTKENIRTGIAVVLVLAGFYLQSINVYAGMLCTAAGILVCPFPKRAKGKAVRIILSALIVIGTYLFWKGILPYYPHRDATGTLRVHYLDLGQAECEFIELPDGKCMLIDSGELDQGSRVVSYVRSCGYTYIDYFCITHPHSDHIGGAHTVLAEMPVGRVILNPMPANLVPDTYCYRSTLEAAQKRGKTIETAYYGQNDLSGSDYSIVIYTPDETFVNDDLNMYSLMIRISYGKTAYLFTGDAGIAEEENIISQHADLQADVLKVGHHGSNDATGYAFIAEVDPAYAVISVGKENKNYLPHGKLLSILEGRGITVYRTDMDGTVIVSTDGYRISVETVKQ